MIICDLPEWAWSPARWEPLFRYLGSLVRTSEKFLPWRRAGLWWSRPQRLLSPSSAPDLPRNCCNPGGHEGSLREREMQVNTSIPSHQSTIRTGRISTKEKSLFYPWKLPDNYYTHILPTVLKTILHQTIFRNFQDQPKFGQIYMLQINLILCLDKFR